VEVAKIIKSHGVNIAVDTSAYAPKSAIDKVIPFVDTFLFDLKAIDEEVHKKCTGVSNKIILENILYVDSLGIPFEIRYPLVPTMNEDQAEKVAEFAHSLKNLKKLRVLPYHSYGQSKYDALGLDYSLSHIEPPSKERVEEISKIMNASSLW
jgi:pyruvate formate lyase activating enzyme